MNRDSVTLFLCGDVMTGRGVDQILWHPNTPELHEPFVRDARDYVVLAEEKNGPIPRPLDAAYIWGDAIAELERVIPDVRIINLETSVTSSARYCRGKAIHYRMHPAHSSCLTSARIDVCALANNHILDYGRAGLHDTLRTLRAADIATAGAGEDLAHAQQPAIVPIGDAYRIIIFSLGAHSAGTPPDWAATEKRPGVDFLEDLSDDTADRLLERVARERRSGDVVIVSLHWGSNWGYEVSNAKIRFAHRLLDGDVALIHGHSSHHPRPIEVYNRKLVLYGCGDFLTDYEGIHGHEEYRGDLAVMYFPTVSVASGELVALRVTPMRIRRMQATYASREESDWVSRTLTRASERFGGYAKRSTADAKQLMWLVRQSI
jgi:poly-gamma-glutamate synthesis protein (capsule biosynthesis protein)